jgi:hypothetical protein
MLEERKSATYGLVLREHMLFSWETDKATGISKQEHRVIDLVVA